MSGIAGSSHKELLGRIARKAMIERGLMPDFPAEALLELSRIEASAAARVDADGVEDLRALPWCSIDNVDSRDLDQLSVAGTDKDGTATVMVAIADVDDLVERGGAIDARAGHNTSTVYTTAEIFHMLPERLSTGLTSLNQDEDRMAIVIEMRVARDGSVPEARVFRAVVKNKARLDYEGVARWLDGEGAEPGGMSAVPGLSANLRIQDRIASSLRAKRFSDGALDFFSREYRPVFSGDALKELKPTGKNRAQELIENLMIAANGAVARFLESKGAPVFTRIVRKPKRWDRIAAIAAERGRSLPVEPDPKALSAFLSEERSRDPEGFPDLSLSVVKLLGPGEYAPKFPGQGSEGHFGLAVKDYAHSTAPNRRYPDLVTHRLVKAALRGAPVPYSEEELVELGARCSEREDAVNKVERQVAKSAAALLLQGRKGENFRAIVTGAADKGTWIRLRDLPVEGRLARGFQGADVGDHIEAKLVSVDVERGYLDFERVRRG